MNKSLLALYGLKWNPFSQELPTEALLLSPKVADFFWRIEQAHVREGARPSQSVIREPSNSVFTLIS